MTSRLRGVLLLAVVVAIGVLAAVIVSDPRRVGVFRTQPGRSPSPGELTWVRLADAPVALTEVAAAVHKGRIWVAGGLDADGQAVDRVMAYDPTADRWTESTPLPSPVHHAALVSDGVALHLIGGHVGDGFDRLSATVWRTEDPDLHAWDVVEPLPEPRAAGAAAWDGHGAILYGGGLARGRLSGDVFALDASGWRQVASLSRPRDHLAASSSAPGTVTFLGGRDTSGNLAFVDTVSVSGDVEQRPGLPTPRGGVAAFAAAGLGDCVVGGEGPDGTFAAVECVEADGTTTLPEIGVARHGLGAVVVDGRVYVLLGGPRPGLAVSPVVEALDLPPP